MEDKIFGKVLFTVNMLGLMMCLCALYLDKTWIEGYAYLMLFLFYIIALIYAK